ncbi:Fc.00g078960.m01.CDS01 [Cosmosporella sp. VM-42]
MGRKRICEIGADGTIILHSLAACATEQTFQVLLGEEDEGKRSRNASRSAAHISDSLVNLTDGAGWSLLHRAVEAGNTSVVWVLIQHGADLNIRSHRNNTPLHTCYAADGDRHAIQELLLKSGADPGLRNKDKKTPLQIAWQKKALQWNCYEIDSGHAAGKKFTPGTQAMCKVLRKVKHSPGPDVIFRKTYELQEMDRGDVLEVYEVLLRECENLQRIEHPFVISYLGYDEEPAEDSDDELPSRAKLYLEYCGGGDLGLAHIEKAARKPRLRRNSTDDDDDDDDVERSKMKEKSKTRTQVVALTESEVWMLMYQLFLALAYLHYGIQVTKEGECGCVPHWKGMIHRDIKPNNVVLAQDENNQPIAKLCDLGISRGVSLHQTRAISRGSSGFQPPELRPESGDESGEEAESNWATKGDIWTNQDEGTIDKLKKDFSPDGKMKEILNKCRRRAQKTRPSSLEVVEEVHKHVEKPLKSLDEELGQGPGGFMLQAFLKIAGGLYEYTNLQTRAQSKTAARPRRLLLERLNLLLEDGAEKPFLTHSSSLHHAVLLNKGTNEKWPKSLWTPLHLAVQQKQLDMVEQLVLAGANDLRDRHGCTAWDYASGMGEEFATECLARREKARRKLQEAVETEVAHIPM